MESLLIRERYKIVRVIAMQPDYALLEAVDISDRETPSCLLNLYEGELLHRYARICSGIRKEDWFLHEASYRRVMSEVYKCGAYFPEYEA